MYDWPFFNSLSNQRICAGSTDLQSESSSTMK